MCTRVRHRDNGKIERERQRERQRVRVRQVSRWGEAGIRLLTCEGGPAPGLELLQEDPFLPPPEAQGEEEGLGLGG